ncbi:AAA family ATPase [Peptococcus simiae]|uniref:AAA family ATPase n=1 Tax=Peptococcus simiae TaxID=1643805 RepID=A0ABW9H0Y0_9FIRM
MKKKNVLNLIKYYSENNDAGFRTEAYEIAKAFDKIGDYQLAEYIMALLSEANTFVPQVEESDLTYVKKSEKSTKPLPLPDAIKEDVVGIINAVGHNIGINKFLFQGPPGTGKTETAKHIARILDRELFVVDFTAIIDSKMGQTGKNISDLFYEINQLPHPEQVVILFDEIDSIALNRTDTRDIREMGRATSAVLKGLDQLNPNVLLIATTNLYSYFDKALLRRFDSSVDFSRYSREDLLEIAEIVLNYYLPKFKRLSKNVRLFRKIIGLMDPLPYPGDLKNLIKTAMAFSNPNSEFDYLRRLYQSVIGETPSDKFKTMQSQGFTVRDIEILTGVSKSQVSRDLQESK